MRCTNEILTCLEVDNDRANESTEASIATENQFSPLDIEQKDETKDRSFKDFHCQFQQEKWLL